MKKSTRTTCSTFSKKWDNDIEITLVRHGATVWNASKRFQGQTDVPLSNEGRAQAQALALALRRTPFVRAFSSDLSRAFDTASAIAQPHGFGVVTDVRLREFDFGQWEGLTWPQIVERWPHLAEQAYTAASLYHPEGGESFKAVVARVRDFLDELRADGGGDALVVSHAGVLHAVLAVLSEDLADFDPLAVSFSTASITRIAMDGDRARLISLNDVSHLRPPR